jgi:hypothetical protein
METPALAGEWPPRLPVGEGGSESRMCRRGFACLALVPLLLSTGCISIFFDMFDDPMGRKAALRLAQREYTKFVRWSDVDAAAKYVHPEVRERFLAYEGQFDAIRITDFDVGQIDFGEEHATATVRVTYHAYSMRSMLEREIRETQRWERLAKSNDWFVRPELEGLVGQVKDLL